MAYLRSGTRIGVEEDDQPGITNTRSYADYLIRGLPHTRTPSYVDSLICGTKVLLAESLYIAIVCSAASLARP